MRHRPTEILINVGHGIDHGFLLIFATAVTAIARDFGMARWEDLMPYSVAAFFLFGLGALPSGKYGDQWGRRPMMILYFAGMGVASILVGLAQSPIQIAIALALLGCAASIYHPVAIPMLLRHSKTPGWTIAVNALAGNLGIAMAALVTGFLIKYFGWRMAFFVPGAASLLCAALFAWLVPVEAEAPARKKTAAAGGSHAASVARILLIMTVASTAASLMYNFSTNSNYELLASKLAALVSDPATLGTLLALVYAFASLLQLVVGSMIDRYPLKVLYLAIIGAQVLFVFLALLAEGWAFYAMMILFMATIFGSVPFADALIVRFVDDSIRSRVAGMRMTISLGASSLAVWLIGPVVKQAGFNTLLALMTAIAVCAFLVITTLPHPRNTPALQV